MFDLLFNNILCLDILPEAPSKQINEYSIFFFVAWAITWRLIKGVWGQIELLNSKTLPEKKVWFDLTIS